MNIYITVMKTTGNNSQSAEYKKAEEMHAPYYQSLIKQRKFIASGPQLAEDGSFAGGGIFLLLVSSRKEAEDIMQNDPLVAEGYSEYTIMEFKPLLVNPELQDFINR